MNLKEKSSIYHKNKFYKENSRTKSSKIIKRQFPFVL